MSEFLACTRLCSRFSISEGSSIAEVAAAADLCLKCDVFLFNEVLGDSGL